MICSPQVLAISQLGLTHPADELSSHWPWQERASPRIWRNGSLVRATREARSPPLEVVGWGWGLSSGSRNPVSSDCVTAFTLGLAALSCVLQCPIPGHHLVKTIRTWDSHKLSSFSSDGLVGLSQGYNGARSPWSEGLGCWAGGEPAPIKWRLGAASSTNICRRRRKEYFPLQADARTSCAPSPRATCSPGCFCCFSPGGRRGEGMKKKEQWRARQLGVEAGFHQFWIPAISHLGALLCLARLSSIVMLKDSAI